MKKSDKCLLFKINLLVSLFGLFIFNSLGQNGQTYKCKETDLDCLVNEYAKLAARECNGKSYDCWFAQYTKIVESNPNDGAAYLGRGRVSFVKEPDRAIQDFNKAIELNPTYFQTYISLGILYSSVKKDYDRAIIEFNKAIEVTAQAGYRKLFYLQNAYVNRGSAYLQKRDFDKALADYNKAIELSPNDDSGYSGLASVYAAQRNFDKAIANYSKAIELSPADWLNYYIRGYLYLKQGEKVKGDADLKKSKELKELENKP